MQGDALINPPVEPATQGDERAIDSLGAAAVLAFSGGALDSFLYLNHGHVFAGVMTGNGVLLGLTLLNHEVGKPATYAVPLLAYVCGLFISAAAQSWFKGAFVRISLTMVLLCFLALSFAPVSLHQLTFNCLTVLATGFLVGISRRAGSLAYNATVITGTLRDAVTGLYNFLFGPADGIKVRRGGEAWTLIGSFIAGATLGGLLAKHFNNHALWLPIAAIGAVLLLVIADPKHNHPEGQDNESISIHSGASFEATAP